jgi:hypothetical protein
MATEHGQQASAQASLEKIVAEKQTLVQERDEQLAAIEGRFDPQRFTLHHLELKPRKADIEVDSVMLVWLPWQIDLQGRAEPLYESNSLPAAGQMASTPETRPVESRVAGGPLPRG